jgi:predicted TIM-barrel fold metal-dependent hydrolase
MLELIGDRLVVLLHGGQEIAAIPDVQPTPERLLALHRRFPDARFILAHLGAYQQWDEVEELLVGENVYFDVSYVFGKCPDERIKRIIRAHGVDKVVWGSDFPWQTQCEGLAGMTRLGLSGGETRAVLSGNLLRLLAGT